MNVGGRGILPTDAPTLTPQPYAFENLDLKPFLSGLRVAVDLAIRDGGEYTAQLFLTDLADKNSQLESDQSVTAEPGSLSSVEVAFESLDEEHVYKLSLGLFDSSGELVKWFDGLSLVRLRQGALETPSTRTIEENPCAAAAR